MNVQEIINLITLAFQGKETQQRQKAEEKLILTCQNDPQAITILCEISCYQNDTLIAQSAALTLITAIKKFISNTKPYPIELRLHHVDLFVQMLAKQISHKIKSHIQLALQQLVNYDKQNHFKGRLKQHIIQSIETQQEHLIAAAFYISETLSLDQDFQWYQFVIKAGKSIEQLPKKTQILWAKALYNQIDKHLHTRQLTGIPEAIQSFFIYNEELCQVLIVNNFQLNADDETIEFELKLISSQRLIFYQILVQYRDQIDVRKCPFFGVLNILTDVYAKTLTALTIHPQFLIQNLSTNQQNLINELIKFLAIACRSVLVYNIFVEQRLTILLDIIYPFFASSEKEIDDFINDPNEFVQLSSDILYNQESDCIKSSIAQLILAMNSTIDGSVSCFTSFATLTAAFQIKKLQNIDVSEQLRIFSELQQHYFLKKMDPNIVLETSIFLLALCSNFVQKRTEVSNMFREFLRDQGDYLLNYSLPLIRSRLCLFIGTYCRFLLKEQDENSYSLLNFLISELEKGQKNKQFANCYCAIDAIKNIIEEPQLQIFLEPFRALLLLKLCEALLDSEYNDHFEAIKSIYKNFQIDQNTLDQSLQLIVNKIQKEQSKVEKGESERQILINQSWNIIKILPEVDTIIPQYFSLVENRVKVLFEYLIDPLKIDFDEDIVYFISQIINKTKLVSDCQAQIFIYCDKILEKQDYMLGQLFELFNYFLMCGKSFFQNQVYQNKLLIMLKSVLMRNELGEGSQAEAVLLLHLLIQEYLLNREVLSFIFSTVIERSKLRVKNDFLKARLMGVFISGFIQNCHQTLSLIEQSGFIFDHIINSYQDCQPGYDISLYIQGINALLLKHPQYLTKQILQNIVFLLKKQYEYQLKKDKDESEDEIFKYNEELEDVKISLESFQSRFTKNNEFTQFQITYRALKQKVDLALIIGDDPILMKDIDELLKINQDGETPRVIMKPSRRKQK